jgi:hypothetical protein
MSGIFIASKTRHAARWRALRSAGAPIVATWIDEAEPGQTASEAELWVRCVREAAGAEALILYREAGEELRGALVEVGAALACGVRVYVVGDVEASWKYHPQVTLCPSVEIALGLILAEE